MRWPLRSLAILAIAASPSLLVADASAQSPPPAGSAAPPSASDLSVEVAPGFGTGNSVAWGWNPIVVRIQNNGTRPAQGEVEVVSQTYGKTGSTYRTRAPFTVGGGAGVHVRVPAFAALYADLVVRVAESTGRVIAEPRFSTFDATGVRLLDVSETSRVRGAINEASISPTYGTSGARGHGSGPTLSVVSPRYDPATGDPILPDRAALYASIDAILMRSDVLARITGAELDALAGYVLAGGTLAVAIARPEDIRLPTLKSLVGGEITKQGVSAATLADLVLPAPPSSMGSTSGKVIPSPRKPGNDLVETLSGYGGGNLRGSLYGASAYYGLGEVHLLAFDPTRKPGADDPFVQARMVDLARRAFDRRSSEVFRQGTEQNNRNDRVRKQLDPNESSRWAIGAAALLLCVYAIIAGPVSFSSAAKKGKPLRALRLLPIFAAITFAIIVGIGLVAKGVTGRARHLTLVEAGAGMSKGTARRWRGFFASRSKELTVRTSDASSVVTTAVLAESADRKVDLVADRDGARLVNVAALPWQTVVVREDGFGSVGEGVAIVKDGEHAVIINRSGRDLRSLLVRDHKGVAYYFPRLKDGDKLTTSGATALSANPDGMNWERSLSSGRRVGSIDVHGIHAFALHSLLDRDAPGLADALGALEESAGGDVDWFPNGVPTVVAQMDGGEGRGSDSGLRLESDRVIVRIVGFGGAR